MLDGLLSLATLLDWAMVLGAVILVVLVAKSIYSIGPTQVGLVRKRFGAKLTGDNPVAFKGEAGYQAELLMPGLRFKFCLIYAVQKHPWVQVPAGQIGVVIAQVGAPTPIGAKSGDIQSRVRQLHRRFKLRGERRPERRPATCSFARHAGPYSSRSLSRHHQAAGLRRAHHRRLPRLGRSEGPAYVCGVRPRRAPARSDAHCTPARRWRKSRGHDRHRDHAGRPAIAGRRHRQSPRIIRRRRGARKESRHHRLPAHRRNSRQQKHAAQQLPGFPAIPRCRRQNRPAARSRFSTAPTT